MDYATGETRWIDMAQRLGRRIVAEALWDGDVCTWPVEALDRESGSSTTRTVAADGVVYQGSAGIALFLGELAAVRGDAAAAKAAGGGIRHALADAAARPLNAFGFYTGRVGVAWVAARLGELLDDAELTRRAGEVLEPMAGHEHLDAGFDVIAGAAGAIAPLLDLAHVLRRPDFAAMAERLGERLLAAARREPGGWSWGTVGPAITRHLAGLGHGACGIATALLELAAARCRGDFRFAAEMAFLYERRLFDAPRSNWPDLRHTELNLLFYSSGADAVRQADEAGTIGPYEPSFMSAWCHGAPGAGLTRLRAWELTGQPLYRREAEIALGPTLETLGPPPQLNFSLCHGIGGNCELPLRAAAAFDAPALADVCHAAAEHGWRTYEAAGRPWSCGTAGGVRDPSLMLGEAGIGLFYLRLARPELPSMLQVRPRGWKRLDLGREDDGHAALAQRWTEERFGTARAVFAALGAGTGACDGSGDGRRPAAVDPPSRSPVEDAYAVLYRRVDASTGEEHRLLADALRVEARRHELEREPNDLTEEYRRRLRRPPADSVDWGEVHLAAAPELELVETERDWTAWLAARRAAATACAASGEARLGSEPPAARPPLGGGGTWLLARLGDRSLARPVGPLAAAVLAAVQTLDPRAASLDAVVEEVAGRLGAVPGAPSSGRVSRRRLREQVAAQAEALYRAGLLDVETPRRLRRVAG